MMQYLFVILVIYLFNRECELGPHHLSTQNLSNTTDNVPLSEGKQETGPVTVSIYQMCYYLTRAKAVIKSVLSKSAVWSRVTPLLWHVMRKSNTIIVYCTL